MATDTAEPAVILYPVADATIADRAERYMELTVKGLTDTTGLAAVHDARMEIKGWRVAVEKKRVELKADALAWGKKVDAEAKRITALLEPIEQHLLTQENAIAEEKARIEREKIEAQRAIVAARVKRRSELLAAVGCLDQSYEVLATLNEESFGAKLTEAREKFEAAKMAEAERLRVQSEEDAKRKAEAEALAAERAELERLRKEQQAEAERIAAEKKKIEDAAAEQQRQADMAKAKAEAAEKARAETEQRLAREAQEKADQEAAELAEKARVAALAPDKEKLEALAAAINTVPIPKLSKASKQAAHDAALAIDQCVQQILGIAAGL